ncbi:MAG TPA: tocopherol cyclase family protein [Candidatus Limiplasma sp.]|nr:tocopherol cyclase family protein [Candidatus Limiplasma sp.]HRX07685.1 tocopherol cyclase family protein [Candidatus Limiplasma sp.]
MVNKSDIQRDVFMLTGPLASCGYDWWWHSFTGRHRETGAEKAFFIEFFTCNPALGGDEPVLGQLPENQREDRKPSYLMIKAGAWGEGAVQLHRFFGWNHVRIADGAPFSVEAEDCSLSETQTSGAVEVSPGEALAHPEWMCGSGSMRWDLQIDKKIAYNVGFGASKPLRQSGAFEMFWHAEGMKTLYSGKVEWNGETYLVDPATCYGYADKNWGKDFTSPWVWLSSNNLHSNLTGNKLNHSVFNIGGGRPKIGNLVLNRKLLGAFYYQGKSYEFNFSKFWTLTRTDFSCRETDTEIHWHVKQETPLHRMETDVTCEKKNMLLIQYESPDGAKRHKRLWNGGDGKGTVKLYELGLGGETLIDDVTARNIGCEYGQYES